jgi:hypothetical protein
MTAEEAGEEGDKIATHHTWPQDFPAAFLYSKIAKASII